MRARKRSGALFLKTEHEVDRTEQGRDRHGCPRCRCKHNAWTPQIAPERCGVDAKKGNAQQHEDRFGNKRFEEGSYRWQRDADDDKRRDCKGPLPAQPRQQCHR